MFWSPQVDKGAEETGVKGFAGRPLRPWLPHLQAARRPHGGRGGDHLAEAGGELADLPSSVNIRDLHKGFYLRRKMCQFASNIQKESSTWEEKEEKGKIMRENDKMRFLLAHL